MIENSEIGGFLELSNLIDKPFYPNFIELNTASNALIFFLMVKGIKNIKIPYYLCPSIATKLENSSLSFSFYHIDENFLPKDVCLDSEEYILIVNYFSLISDDVLNTVSRYFKRVIIDNTQSFFQKPISSLTPTIYSCRKFLSVPDGAYLSGLNLDAKKMKEASSNIGWNHVIGRTEKSSKLFYKSFRLYEEILYNAPILKMSKSTKLLIGAFDYEKIIMKRINNYKYLFDNLNHPKIKKFLTDNVPYGFPILVDDGNFLRSELIRANIFVSKYWESSQYSRLNNFEKELTDNLVVIPCDQRLEKKDLDYIIDTICSKLVKFEREKNV